MLTTAVPNFVFGMSMTVDDFNIIVKLASQHT